MKNDFQNELEVGDIVLVERIAPIILSKYYPARITWLGEKQDDGYGFQRLFRVKPTRGIFRLEQWMTGLWMKAVVQRKEIAELERSVGIHAIVLFTLAALFAGCGGAAQIAKNITPSKPVSTPAPAPAPPPTTPPPAPPPTPTPPPPVPVPPAPPTPQIVGHGANVMLNIVDDAPVIAFENGDGTHAGSAVYPGALADFEQGVALSYTFAPGDVNANATLYRNGVQLVIEPEQNPPILINNTMMAAWPIGNEVLLAASANYEAHVIEDGTNCDVTVNQVLVASDSLGCADTIKVIEAQSAVYVGWSDGQGVSIYQSQDQGQKWQVAFQFGGKMGVFGADFAIQSDGTILAAWTQYDAGEGGSAVYQWSGGSPTRLSGNVRSGFSGAGNPAVAGDGAVAWMDDTNGTVSGHFDVFLNGVDLSNTDDAIDEGPRLGLLRDGTRVVAWDDESTVWMEEVPQ